MVVGIFCGGDFGGGDCLGGVVQSVGVIRWGVGG